MKNLKYTVVPSKVLTNIPFLYNELLVKNRFWQNLHYPIYSSCQCGLDEIILESERCLCRRPGSLPPSVWPLLFPFRISLMCCTMSPIATKKREHKKIPYKVAIASYWLMFLTCHNY